MKVNKEKTVDYLDQVLGIRVVYKEGTFSVPNFIHARYRLQMVTLDGKAAVFVYPNGELETVSAVKKHLERVENTVNVPAVLIPEHLTFRQKGYLLRDHIPFIVEGKQIYLPFMALYLQERGDSERPDTEKMLPSAQLLLLCYIYHGCGELLTSKAAQELGFTATSISRASRQLEEMGLIRTEKRGVQKVIYSDQTPEELFASAREHMRNPVKRTIYIPVEDVSEELLLSGYSALSEYSMMNPPMAECFAAGSIAAWEKAASNRLESAEDQCAVELWRYDPRKLTKDHCVDRLSLALALSADKDERIEEAVEEMLTSVWREIDGKRN
jgi:DNA-binding MarR family transcriptional regulator